MAKLTVKELEAFSITKIGETVRDDGGLWGRIRSNGRLKNGVSITFWYRYKWEGKTKDITCGTWPGESIADIRKKRDDARKLVSNGINPSDQKKLQRQEHEETVAAKLAEYERQKNEQLTFRQMFEAWLANGVRRKDGNAELERSFNADVLPQIGSKQVRAIDEHDIRNILRIQVSRGVNRTAVATRNNLMQIFGWAEKRQPWRKLLVEGNPVALIEIEKILSPAYDIRNTRDRILSRDEISELWTKLKKIRSEHTYALDKRTATRPVARTTEIGIWLMLSTMCRVGELSMARWEHVNFDAKEWFIPKQNVKGNVSDLRVYLSDFALGHFRELYELTKFSVWCFPATNKDGHICVKSMSKQIGDRQLQFKRSRSNTPRGPMANRAKDGNALVLGNGKLGEWTPHDLRRTGATMMQGLGIPLDIIDRCQNHVLAGSKIRRHYLHHDYAGEKREAWRLLGESLMLICMPVRNVSDAERV